MTSGALILITDEDIIMGAPGTFRSIVLYETVGQLHDQLLRGRIYR